MEKRPATKNRNTENDPLPLSSLRLSASPLRMVSAAMWRVMKNRDVLHYGKLEAFVTSISAASPILLSCRHRAKLILGLRARMVLELCRGRAPPDPSVVLPHLERLQPLGDPSNRRRDDVKVRETISKFHELVQGLLDNPARRKYFFQEVFPVEFGPEFDNALEKLLWEFLVRLDILLPVPDLAQTVQWLSTAHVVLEEHAQFLSEPQLLRSLFQHQRCLGYLHLPDLSSSLGDSILSSLSLALSGRVPSDNQPSDGESDSRKTRVMQDCREADGGSCVRPVAERTEERKMRSTLALCRQGKEESRKGIKGSDHDEATRRPGLHSDISLRESGRKELQEETSKRAKSCYQQEEEDENERAQREKQGGALNRGSGRTDWTQSSLVAACLNSQPRVLVKQLSLADIHPRSSVVSGARSPAKQDKGSSEFRVKRKRKLWMTPKILEAAEKENSADHPVASSASPVISPFTQKTAVRQAVLPDQAPHLCAHAQGVLEA
ncbi:TERF1-interacting nuclear factor 2 isoform X2 [Brienomyrus brachyistius]|uniref:TERF1-interacting nuclear factor 2 isoform X2 n=1 Tax=Brienomyrus brachyistius TaxID=42636 RepID=UPI0020B349EC|nr:TERF1-interacting nuclear factor 2 isoform X2 [Brienomyrus brachyistius]